MAAQVNDLFPPTNIALPGMETECVRADDIILTPADVARDVVKHYKPTGLCLDPCRGNGVFSELMPGCGWCEIRDGRDFFGWTQPVDWIVSNPPYSIFAEWLRHSFRVAENIVYVIPVNKVYNSDRMMREIWTWGGDSRNLRHRRRWGARLPNRVLHRCGTLQTRLQRWNNCEFPFTEQRQISGAVNASYKKEEYNSLW